MPTETSAFLSPLPLGKLLPFCHRLELLHGFVGHLLKIGFCLSFEDNFQVSAVGVFPILHFVLGHGVEGEAFRTFAGEGGVEEIRDKVGTGLVGVAVVLIAKDKIGSVRLNVPDREGTGMTALGCNASTRVNPTAMSRPADSGLKGSVTGS